MLSSLLLSGVTLRMWNIGAEAVVANPAPKAFKSEMVGPTYQGNVGTNVLANLISHNGKQRVINSAEAWKLDNHARKAVHITMTTR